MKTFLWMIFGIVLVWPVSGNAEQLDFGQLMAPELKKYMVSRNVAYRRQVMESLFEYDSGGLINLAPVSDLSWLLLKGLADRDSTVRFAAIEAVGCHILRLSTCRDADKIEGTLERLLFGKEIGRDVLKDIGGNKTRARTEALSVLAQLKYNRLPLPRYLRWENEVVISEIDVLADSNDVIDQCGAVKLCEIIQSEGENRTIAVKVLRQSLLSKSEELRKFAILFMPGRGTLDLNDPGCAFICASLLRDIREVAGSDSSAELRSQAKTLADDLERTLKRYEDVFGLKLELVK